MCLRHCRSPRNFLPPRHRPHPTRYARRPPPITGEGSTKKYLVPWCLGGLYLLTPDPLEQLIERLRLLRKRSNRGEPVEERIELQSLTLISGKGKLHTIG